MVSIKSLYIHYPFCRSKCNYCSFYSILYNKNIEEIYIERLKDELKYYFNMYDFSKIETVYIGGGNPANNSSFITRISEFVSTLLSLKQIKEFTIEANPLNINKEFLNNCKDSYVNRISLGIQSFCNEAIKYAGRLNQNNDIIENALQIISDYNFNTSIDLINGLPYSVSEYELLYLNKLLSAYDIIKHISLYDLSIDNETVFYNNKEKGLSDEERGRYEDGFEKLIKGYNFRKYEVSNFCKPDFESLHNKTYWQYNNYLGVGPSAHSTLGNIRIENKKDIKEYLNNYLGDKYQLTETDMIEEYLLMGLRLRSGISLTDFKEKFGFNLFDKIKKTIDLNIKNDNIVITADNLSTTEKGENILNKILISIFEEIELSKE